MGSYELRFKIYELCIMNYALCITSVFLQSYTFFIEYANYGMIIFNLAVSEEKGQRSGIYKREVNLHE